MAARYDWETIRAEYEAGSTMGALSRKHGVTKSAISQRVKREGWTQDVSDAVNRIAKAKLNGVLNTVNPQKKAEALGRAADEKVSVIIGQREAWAGFDADVKTALSANDFDRLKCLKIASETMRNVQECQRKAWGIRDAVETPQDATLAQASIVVDLSHAGREQISRLVDAAYGEKAKGARE